jgi:hypothetical protein
MGTAVTGVDAGAVTDVDAKPKGVGKKSGAPSKTGEGKAGGKQCGTCGEIVLDCICPAVVEERETKYRQKATIDVRIWNMLSLCTDLQQAIGDESTQGEMGSIQARGSHLAAQYDVIQKHMEEGVVTGALTSRHIEEVDNWMKRCDAFNVALCRVGSEKLTSRPNPAATITNGVHEDGPIDDVE